MTALIGREREKFLLPGPALKSEMTAFIGREMMDAKPKEKVLEKYKETEKFILPGAASIEKKFREQLTFKQIAKYSVTDKTDAEIPFITKIELLPDDRILLADSNNRNLKMLDSSFKLVSSCDLPYHGSPICVCYIGKKRAVVSFNVNGIQIVNVSDGLVIEKFHELDHTCFGLACYSDILYISDQNGRINTYSTEDIRKGSFHKDTFHFLGPYGIMIPWFNSIAISDDGEKIYIGSNKIITTVDNKGHILSILETDIWNPIDMCVAGDGTVLVLDFSGDILRVDYEGKNIIKAELLPKFAFPGSLCFYRKYSTLIVGGREEYIHVYEVQK